MEDPPAGNLISQQGLGSGDNATPLTQPAPDLPIPEPKPVDLPLEIVQFAPEDLRDLTASYRYMNLTPRSIKRLVNVLRLVQVFWYRTLGYDRHRQAKRAVMGLLALAAAYPDVMVEVLAQMEPYFRTPAKAGTNPGKVLTDMSVDEIKLTDTIHRVLTWQFERYQDDVAAMCQIIVHPDTPPVDYFNISLGELGISSFNLIRSFSLIGDPTYTMDDVEDPPAPPTTPTPGKKAA